MMFLSLNAVFLRGKRMISGVCCLATVLLLSSSLSAAMAEECYRIQTRPRQIQLFDVPNGGTSVIEAEDGKDATKIEINLSRSASSWADCLAKFSVAQHVTIRTTGDARFSLEWMKHLQSVQTLDDAALRHLIAADQHRRLVFDGSQCSPKEWSSQKVHSTLNDFGILTSGLRFWNHSCVNIREFVRRVDSLEDCMIRRRMPETLRLAA